MKKHFNMMKSLLALAVVSLICSCTGEKENYLKVVPEDARMAFSVNLASLGKKADLANDLMVQGAVPMLLLTVDQENQEFAKEIFDNPQKSGVDFTKPLVVAVGGDMANKNPEVVAVMAVDNKEALKKVVDTFGQKAGLGITTKGDVVTVDFPQEGGSVAFDGTSLVLLVSQNRKALDLMDLPTNRQAIVCDPYFAPAVAGTADIAYYGNYDQIFSMLPKDQLAQSGMSDEMLQMFKDMRACSATNFEDGKIVTDMKVYGAEEVLEFSKKFQREMTGKHFDYLPESPAAVFSTAVQQLAELLKLYPEEWQQKVEEFFQQNEMKTSDLNSIEGDITLAFLGMNNNFPQLFLALDFNADSLKNNEERDAREIKKLVESGQFKEISKNLLVSTMSNLPEQFYFGLIDNTVYFMNESMGRKLIKDGKIEKQASNFRSNALASNFNKSGGLIIDFKQVLYVVNPLLAGNQYQTQVATALSKFDNLVITGEFGTSNSTTVIEMTDKSKNSLRQIVELCEQLATGR